jgi:hypothetical protein
VLYLDQSIYMLYLCCISTSRYSCCSMSRESNCCLRCWLVDSRLEKMDC